MHPVPLRLDVQRARRDGLPPAWVAFHYGVPSRTQQRIVQEALVPGMTDTEFRKERAVGRPSTLTPEHEQLLLGWTQENPALPSIEGVRRLTSDHGYLGGKTVVYEFLKSHRPPKKAPPPVVRFEGLPGEFGQHDFGEFLVTYLGGKKERIHFYAGRLKYSRMVHVEPIRKQSTEAMIRGMEGLAALAGGLPLQNVVDNTKAAVVSRTRNPDTGEEKIVLQTQFASFLREADVHANPCAPYSGNQKGSVENLVGFVKSSFFMVRQFRNREDLERQLKEWERWVNDERKCDATGEIPRQRLAAERDRLRPLVTRFDTRVADYGLVHTAVGRPDGVVRFENNRYSIPDEWIGQPVTVHLHRETVRLICITESVVHGRLHGSGQESLLIGHWGGRFLKRRGEIMAKREILIQLCGTEAFEFFTELVHRRPQSWETKDLPVLWQHFERHGQAQFEAALRHCRAAETIGGEYVQAYLQDAPHAPLPERVILQRRRKHCGNDGTTPGAAGGAPETDPGSGNTGTVVSGAAA